MNSDSDHLPDRILSMHEQAVREMEEPRDGISPTPVTFLLMCFVLAAWSGFYLADNRGNWSGVEYNAKPSQLATSTAAVAENPMVLGLQVFSSCSQCHQADGRGLAGTYPPLVASEYVTGDVRRFAAILLNGINGSFPVNGVNYSGQMPNWRDYYNDEELAAVMTYARNSWGNKAPAVSIDSVAKVRSELAANGGVWSASSLAVFAAEGPKAAGTAK